MNFFVIEKPISKNKAICLQLSWFKPWVGKLLRFDMHVLTEEHIFRIGLQFLCFFDFQFDWTRKRDHAGLYISFDIFGLAPHFEIYDSRHWDDENDDWQVYESSDEALHSEGVFTKEKDN